MGASINRGPKNRPKYIMVLIIGTAKMGPLICGNSHISYIIYSVLYSTLYIVILQTISSSFLWVSSHKEPQYVGSAFKAPCLLETPSWTHLRSKLVGSLFRNLL